MIISNANDCPTISNRASWRPQLNYSARNAEQARTSEKNHIILEYSASNPFLIRLVMEEF